jgi:predicted nuclease of restriction endonuclease-like (RecB) superfamily
MTRTPAGRTAGLPADYPELLSGLKTRIAAARTRAALAVNSELIRLYWEIGRDILDRERREGWGTKVIDRLAADLRRDFPEMTGLSRSNLHYMRSFADAWPCERGSEEIVQQAVGRLPWGQNIALLTRLEDRDARLWYAGKAVENSWSRKILEAQIATDLRGRQGSALTSFDHDLNSASLDDALEDADLALILTAHPQVDHQLLAQHARLLVDLQRGHAHAGGGRGGAALGDPRAVPRGGDLPVRRVETRLRLAVGTRTALSCGRRSRSRPTACRTTAGAPRTRGQQRALTFTHAQLRTVSRR